MSNNQLIETKLAELRKQWKKYPDRRKTIKLQAKILRLSQEKKQENK